MIISFNTVSLLSILPQHCPAWFKTVQPVSKGSRRLDILKYITYCPDGFYSVRTVWKLSGKFQILKWNLKKHYPLYLRTFGLWLLRFFLCCEKYICVLRLRKKKSQFNKMDNLIWRSCNIWSLDPKNVVSKNPRVIFSAAIFLIYNPVTFSSDPHQLIS